MSASIEVTMDAVDVERAASFWQQALGYRRRYARDPYVVLGPPDGDPRPTVLIQRVDRVTPDKTPVHLDLRVDDPEAEVARLEELGATVRWEIAGTAEGGQGWTTMADPQGTLFCVCAARWMYDPAIRSRGTEAPGR